MPPRLLQGPALPQVAADLVAPNAEEQPELPLPRRSDAPTGYGTSGFASSPLVEFVPSTAGESISIVDRRSSPAQKAEALGASEERRVLLPVLAAPRSAGTFYRSKVQAALAWWQDPPQSTPSFVKR